MEGHGGGELRSQGCGRSQAAVSAATPRPPNPRSSASRAGRVRGKAGRSQDLATAGGGACGGATPSCARRSAAQEASLRGPGGNFSLEALLLTRVHARSHSGTRTPSAHLPRAPSVYFFLLLSFSHSKIGQEVEVTPGAASGSDAKAAFSPRLQEGIATIRLGEACCPQTVQKARCPEL